ncbi:class I adenylate-forming enzyme family protein [Roseateles sp. BYS180W]|uniref:Class I adenylate-forming enzyme family protein n=1 Tax=Roseateles rivi TaxID=3299028 RepID=A0ABW7FWY8_9BURK
MLFNDLIQQVFPVDPGRPAFVQLDGETVSYPEFARRCQCHAQALLDQGVQPAQRVALLGLNSITYMELFMAVPWMGAVLVPLNIRWSLKELQYAVEDAEITVLLVDDAFAKLAVQLREKCPRLSHLIYVGNGPCPEGMVHWAAHASTTSPLTTPAAVRPDTLAAIVYTGGTTGDPKGVMHTQASLMAAGVNLACLQAPAGEQVYLAAVPLFHTAGFGMAMGHLVQRGTLAIVPMFRPDLVQRAVRELGVTGIGLVPSMLGMVLDAPGFKAEDYRDLRGIYYGASPMPAGLLRRVMEAFPQARFTQVYGMTESGIAASLDDRFHRGPNAQTQAAGQVGPLYRMCIEDEQGNPQPPGVQGEVVIYGAGVMAGYLNKPEATRAAIGGGGMRTGDAGMMDANGVLTLMDRIKDMIITGGENVYSVEVESVISRHPAVSACAIIGVPDELYGERVHAVVVVREQHVLTLEALRSYCAEYISNYKCPRSLELREALPLSPMGKVQKNELRAPHWAGQAKRIN